ncbi:hypothetical protein PIB30_070268 [Stylosanthes scabra]|uniref:Uncharacterized protein n=1 Tax=Stylosanthes scabra TaxID=79078 RepID=A0ABU6RNS8_9FABA|nr:hypothetical protein [Stylosanthes scabra]
MEFAYNALNQEIKKYEQELEHSSSKSPRRLSALHGGPTSGIRAWLIGLALRGIYEKHRKSSRQGGLSSESRDGVMDEYSNVVKELRKRGVEYAQCGDSHLRGRLFRLSVLSLMWCLLILCSLTWLLPGFSPTVKCSPRWPNKWYQSRWLIGLVLKSIYEKYRKSSRQGGSRGESRGVVRRCDGRILKCGKGARGSCARCGDSHLNHNNVPSSVSG